jgi:hypothetical protein
MFKNFKYSLNIPTPVSVCNCFLLIIYIWTIAPNVENLIPMRHMRMCCAALWVWAFLEPSPKVLMLQIFYPTRILQVFIGKCYNFSIPIQLSRGEGWHLIKWLNHATFCGCPKLGPGFTTSYVVVVFRVQWVNARGECSVWLVGLLTITV